MANKRIYIVARENGLTSKEIMQQLRGMGSEVKSQMKSPDEETAAKVSTRHRANLPKDLAKEDLTLEKAVELIGTKAKKAPAKKAAAKKKAPAKKKAATKKKTAAKKKAAAKKNPAAES